MNILTQKIDISSDRKHGSLRLTARSRNAENSEGFTLIRGSVTGVGSGTHGLFLLTCPAYVEDSVLTGGNTGLTFSGTVQGARIFRTTINGGVTGGGTYCRDTNVAC